MSKPKCFDCGSDIEGVPVENVNNRTGNVWLSHPDCHGPTPDSYAFTARMMAGLGGDDDFDWDRWKDDMKEGDY